ncbi:MAG: phage holin family protein [Acidobacteriota bacterium]
MIPEKSLVESFEELRDDLKSFLETRYQILRAELKTGFKNSLSGVIVLGIGGVLGLMGLLLLSVCASLAVAMGLGAIADQYGLIWGFLIIGGAEVVVAGIMAGAGVAKLKSADLTPKRTLHVLQRDQQVLREGGQQYGESERTRRRA